MELKHYQKQALGFSRTRTHEEALANGALGLCGEAAELVTAPTEKRSKEAGDVLWYLALICTMAEVSLHDLWEEAERLLEPERYDALDLLVKTGFCADYLKKVVHQSHPLIVETLRPKLLAVTRQLLMYMAAHHLDVNTVAAENIEKLFARYATGKFSVEESQHRKAADE